MHGQNSIILTSRKKLAVRGLQIGGSNRKVCTEHCYAYNSVS